MLNYLTNTWTWIKGNWIWLVLGLIGVLIILWFIKRLIDGIRGNN